MPYSPLSVPVAASKSGSYIMNAWFSATFSSQSKMRSVILCEDVGDGAVIGAASVVLSDVPENALSAGNPAEVKKILPS